MNKVSSILALYMMMTTCISSGQPDDHRNLSQDTTHMHTNELIHESSPYLLQHAHNPVNWYPWGEVALKKAKRENKMLIISIGYAACHWCHVMEHESFEDTAVARLMNENFVAIKVDREERPDVDQVYMEAAHLISGRGGWPLNALALPDGRPFYAGTYFPRDDWVKVLEYFAEAHKERPETLRKQADQVTKGIQDGETVPLVNTKTSFSENDIDRVFNRLREGIDTRRGGMNRAPKFPMPSVWEYLLQYAHLSANQNALNAVTVTLDNMAMGGIYDHVGGGFARYSTDTYWHVPHFEKMLYDNAQLVSLYSHAYQSTKNPLYREVVYETLEFIEREMSSSEGGFYSSLDADSEGEEGKYYVWTLEEIEKALGDEAGIFVDFFNISAEGNWEHGKNILFRNSDEEEIAKQSGLSQEELHARIMEQKKLLQDIRSRRVKPGLDDKILTSWNALMLKGYVHAYRAFGEKKFLESAIRNADFLVKNSLGTNKGITRNYKDGKSSIPGFLDDYAFTISAFIELYQADFDEQWLNRAHELAAYTVKNFSDPESGMFFYTHKDHSDLIARKMEISDNVIPASNSEMARNLLVLGHFFYKEDYIERAMQMLTNVRDDVHGNIFYYSNWGILEVQFVHPPFEVAILGTDNEDIRQSMDEHYLPDVLLSGGQQEGTLELHKNKLVIGQTTIYVCRDKICKLPVTEVSEALLQLRQ